MFRGTTIVCVRKDGAVALAGDGQVTMGNTVMKHTARKIRRMYEEKVLAGFAGSTADAFTLFEKFYQIDPNRTGQVQGFGLALFYARRFIRDHVGRLQLTTSPRPGTTPDLTLPRP